MNNTMVREIRGTKINPKPSFKNQGAQNTRGRKLREQIRYLWLVIIRLSYLEGIEEKGYLSASNFCVTQSTTLSLLSENCKKKPLTEEIQLLPAASLDH